MCTIGSLMHDVASPPLYVGNQILHPRAVRVSTFCLASQTPPEYRVYINLNAPDNRNAFNSVHVLGKEGVWVSWLFGWLLTNEKGGIHLLSGGPKTWQRGSLLRGQCTRDHKASQLTLKEFCHNKNECKALHRAFVCLISPKRAIHYTRSKLIMGAFEHKDGRSAPVLDMRMKKCCSSIGSCRGWFLIRTKGKGRRSSGTFLVEIPGVQGIVSFCANAIDDRHCRLQCREHGQQNNYYWKVGCYILEGLHHRHFDTVFERNRTACILRLVHLNKVSSSSNHVSVHAKPMLSMLGSIRLSLDLELYTPNQALGLVVGRGGGAADPLCLGVTDTTFKEKAADKEVYAYVVGVEVEVGIGVGPATWTVVGVGYRPADIVEPQAADVGSKVGTTIGKDLDLLLPEVSYKSGARQLRNSFLYATLDVIPGHIQQITSEGASVIGESRVMNGVICMNSLTLKIWKQTNFYGCHLIETHNLVNMCLYSLRKTMSHATVISLTLPKARPGRSIYIGLILSTGMGTCEPHHARVNKTLTEARTIEPIHEHENLVSRNRFDAKRWASKLKLSQTLTSLAIIHE
ncbi:hypothetical protein VNO77_44740 [Canavalia gladiata]|uniref:Uncharacterized protein n=1 Tax=Canavalia gladiata TaxID=3824 RepID=A0AAN9PRB2_CANGL